MEILVLHPGALGDIILSLPALGMVRRLWPGARVTLAANLDFAEVVAVPAADRLRSLSALPLHRLRCGNPLPPEDRHLWGSFDRVLSWTGAGDAEFESGLARANPDSRTAAWRPREGEKRHVSRLFMNILEPWLGEDASPVLPEVAVLPERLEVARSWLQAQGWNPDEKLLAIHPGAGSRQKRWPLECFAELLRDWLPGARRRAVVLEGPAEEGVGDGLVRRLPAGSAVAAARLPLSTVAGVLSLCGACVGSDSGVTHLAAALGLPAVALFGPTDPDLWAPLGPRVRVLRQASGCRGCRGEGDSLHSCMDSIPVGSVLAALEAVQSMSMPPFTSIDSPCR